MNNKKFLWYIQSEKDIDTFLGEYFDLPINDISVGRTSRSIRLFKSLLETFKLPFSIMRETNHIDKAYSEGYYTYYSNKHMKKSRFCERLSFFSSKITRYDFTNENKHAALQKKFIGCVVIQPTVEGILGRSLINPRKLTLQNYPCYIRVSTYEVDIRGVRLTVSCFPFRMQDHELTTCAEVTLLNLLEYFGHRYDEYRNIYAEELLRVLQKNSVERVVPTHGLSYSVMTKTLSEVGFSPRLYSGPIYINQQSNVKNILYYYVESGLPVGVGEFTHDSKSNQWSTGHSTVCIGHTSKKQDCPCGIEKRINENDFYYCNAADFYDEYIMMDDNEHPYITKNLADKNMFSPDTELNIMVPLYKRMFMEATDAYSIAKKILIHSDISIDKVVSENFKHLGTKTSPIVMRLFLASSKSYKASKMKLPHKDFDYIKAILFDIPLPRFIWVCELYEKQEFDKPDNDNVNIPLACGEILIDATANSASPRDCLLLVHYPEVISYRYPNQDWDVIFSSLKSRQCTIKGWNPFPGFNQNLTKYIFSENA